MSARTCLTSFACRHDGPMHDYTTTAPGHDQVLQRVFGDRFDAGPAPQAGAPRRCQRSLTPTTKPLLPAMPACPSVAFLPDGGAHGPGGSAASGPNALSRLGDVLPRPGGA